MQHKLNMTLFKIVLFPREYLSRESMIAKISKRFICWYGLIWALYILIK